MSGREIYNVNRGRQAEAKVLTSRIRLHPEIRALFDLDHVRAVREQAAGVATGVLAGCLRRRAEEPIPWTVWPPARPLS
ncbi:hypothetical protein [Amycolatopsis samaneae]|uniref:Uncharacterized protein n=1 Tax=Amycolatopsis samaneae TaxID=664691 RepID=A0ABW5GSQ8_9PSEU